MGSILQNKFGGVDERALPQNAEDFFSINGVFPRFAGLQNRILGKQLLNKGTSPIYGIFQSWTPFGYGRGYYQTGGDVLTDVWTPPPFRIPVLSDGSIPVLPPAIPSEEGGSDGIPTRTPPKLSGPVTSIADPTILESEYEIFAGSYVAKYGSHYDGGNGDPSYESAIYIHPFPDIPYVSEGLEIAPIVKASLSATEVNDSGANYDGGLGIYKWAEVHSSGDYINAILDLSAYGPVTAAILSGTDTYLAADGSTKVRKIAISLFVDPITYKAEVNTKSPYFVIYDTVATPPSVSPNEIGARQTSRTVSYTHLDIYHGG